MRQVTSCQSPGSVNFRHPILGVITARSPLLMPRSESTWSFVTQILLDCSSDLKCITGSKLIQWAVLCVDEEESHALATYIYIICIQVRSIDSRPRNTCINIIIIGFIRHLLDPFERFILLRTSKYRKYGAIVCS